MLARHQNALLTALERVEDIGCVEITKNQLLLWHDKERVTKGIWREVIQKWDEVHGSEDGLLVGDSDGLWVFVYGDGLTTSSDSWLKDVRDLT